MCRVQRCFAVHREPLFTVNELSMGLVGATAISLLGRVVIFFDQSAGCGLPAKEGTYGFDALGFQEFRLTSGTGLTLSLANRTVQI